MKKKVAIVVQRYGSEVVGGAEGLAKDLSEQMAGIWDITVVTTCAKSYQTWKNEYKEGEERINGIKVLRFACDSERDFAAYSKKAASTENKAFRLSAEEELEHFREQGPDCPKLVAYLEKSYDAYDVFLFFTYLYYPSAMGIPKVIDKAYLLSTAHDEPPFYFAKTYAPLFHSLKGIIYLAEEEKELINRIYRVPDRVKQIKGGYGAPLPSSISSSQEAEFRKKFPWMDDAPYFIYVGRASTTKCVPDLIQAYLAMASDYDIASKLVFAGTMEADVDIPADRGDIIRLGYVSAEEKSFLLQNALALVNPSPVESLSMVVLEAWQHGTPVIVNGESLVMKGLCDRSGGGVYYHTQPMFKGLLAWATKNGPMAKQIGKNGFEFVRTNYQWDDIKRTLEAEVV